MAARLRSWWEKVRKHPLVIGLIALLVVSLLIFLGYRLDWHWTGFSNKTLWDWFNLLGVLAIPAVVGLGAAWYTAQQGKVSERANTDNQRQAALQAYIDKMSELLLEKHLRESQPSNEARMIARVRTITILFQLDARRIGYVFAFLRESRLLSTKPSSNVVNSSGAPTAIVPPPPSQTNLNSYIVSLSGADLNKISLSRANLSEFDLSETDLSSADLRGTNLKYAKLSIANLSEADLRGADLFESNLTFANLSGADLSGAGLLKATLRQANLSGANLSNADLRGVDLSMANLNGASLRQADLSSVSLSGADLSGADLSGADLFEVYLVGAKVTEEQLKKAKSLEGATMLGGEIHP